MPVPGQFAITCEVNGQVADALNGVRSQMGDPVELRDFCDLKKLVAKRKATEAAMQTGQVTQEMARDMTPEQKAAMEKAMKERSASMAKNKRGGKIFIDYLRNDREATAIAAYSPRARPGAPVALPIAWEELGSRASAPPKFGLRDVPALLRKRKADPWAEFDAARRTLV